jgi:hypothetical protein
VEFDGQKHPHGNGLRAFARGIEPPPAHGLCRGAVEGGVPGRVLDLDLTDPSIVEHENTK